MSNMLRLAAHALVVFFSCRCGTGFVPAPHRLGGTSNVLSTTHHSSSRRPVSVLLPTPRMASNDNDVPVQTTPTPWSLCGTAAACLATATILSSSAPTDASAIAELSSGLLERNGASTMMVLSEADDTAGGRTDATGSLASELRRADKAESVLNTMVKINDVVDGDEEGVLENTFAKESIVRGMLEKRRAGGDAWNGDTEAAFGILKRKLDPFNVVILRPYLKIAPFLGGAYYLAVFFVQQKFRGFFAYAYFGAVAVFVAPAAIILLTN